MEAIKGGTTLNYEIPMEIEILPNMKCPVSEL